MDSCRIGIRNGSSEAREGAFQRRLTQRGRGRVVPPVPQVVDRLDHPVELPDRAHQYVRVGLAVDLAGERDDVPANRDPDRLLTGKQAVRVTGRVNVVTLSGEVDRKTDADILMRTIRELDGVVEAIDDLRYRWDDTTAAALRQSSLEGSFTGF